MRLSLLLIFISLTANTFSQNSKQIKRISVGYSFSPDYSFRSLKNNNGTSSTDLVINNRNDIEEAKIGFTTGLNINLHFTELFSIGTGLNFSNKGYKTKESDLINFPPEPNRPNKLTTTYSYKYIGLPINAKFSFGNNKTRFTSSAGFMTNFLIDVKQTFDYKYADGRTEKDSQSSNSGYNKIEISPMLSIGIDYKLANKIYLSAEPTFRFGLIETRDAPVQEKLWNAGLCLSITYDLK